MTWEKNEMNAPSIFSLLNYLFYTQIYWREPRPISHILFFMSFRLNTVLIIIWISPKIMFQLVQRIHFMMRNTLSWPTMLALVIVDCPFSYFRINLCIRIIFKEIIEQTIISMLWIVKNITEHIRTFADISTIVESDTSISLLPQSLHQC